MRHLHRLALLVLLLTATWACLQVGRAFEAVRVAAERTSAAMSQTVEYRAAAWEPEPPEEE